MRRPSVKMMAAGAVSALVVGMTALPVGGQDDAPEPEVVVESVSGEATGMSFDLFEAGGESPDLELSAGPAPHVVLPPEGGGPFTDSLVALELDDSTIAGPLEVSTEGALGPDGFAESVAVVENLVVEDLIVTADLVEVECRSDLEDGPVGSTTILGGESLDLEDGTIDLPSSPAPNTVVIDDEISQDFGGGTQTVSLVVVVNEQTVDEHSISVVGVRVALTMVFTPAGAAPELLSQLDMVVGMTSCGIVPAEIPPVEPLPLTTPPAPAPLVVEPRFTG